MYKKILLILILILVCSLAYAQDLGTAEDSPILFTTEGEALLAGNALGYAEDFEVDSTPKRVSKNQKILAKDGEIEVINNSFGLTGGELTLFMKGFNTQDFGVAGVKIPGMKPLELYEFTIDYGIEENIPYESPIWGTEQRMFDWDEDGTEELETFKIITGYETKYKKEIIWGKNILEVNGKNTYVKIKGKWKAKLGKKGIDVLIKYGDWRKELAWWDTDYSYSRPISITNNATVTLQDGNNAILLELGSTLGAKAQTDCSDVKIVYQETTQIDANIMGNCQTDANIWWQLGTDITAGGTSTDYNLYYGKTGDTPYSNTTGLSLPATVPNMSHLLKMDGTNNTYGFGGVTVGDAINQYTNGVRDNQTVQKTNAADRWELDFPSGAGGLADYNNQLWEIWLRSPSYSNQHYMGGGRDAADQDDAFLWRIGTDNKLDLLVRENLAIIINNQSTITVGDTNMLHHHAFLCGDNGWEYYIDNKQVLSGAATTCPQMDTYDPYLFHWNANGSPSGDAAGNSQVFDDFRLLAANTPFTYTNVQYDINRYAIRPTATLGAEATVPGVTANFNYTINKTTTSIDFNDTSTVSGVTIDDWNWLIGGAQQSTDQNYVYTATELTDYNACLTVIDSTDAYTDQNCQQFNSGDWTAPDGNVTISDNGNGTAELKFQCYDTNSGCNQVRYEINDTNVAGDISSGSFDVNITGSGSFEVCWDMNDIGYIVSANTSAESCSTYTVLGNFGFTIWDEITQARLTGTTITSNIAINGKTTWNLAGSSQDINLFGFGASNQRTRFTIEKSGYGVRYYELDLNQYVDGNINFLMLERNRGEYYAMKFWDANATTLWTENYVEYFDNTFNRYSAGRLKTDASGELDTTRLFYHLSDVNFTQRITDDSGTTYDYNAVLITINRPLLEEAPNASPTDDLNWHIVYADLNNSPATDINATSRQRYFIPNIKNGYTLGISEGNDYNAIDNERPYSFKIGGTYCTKQMGCDNNVNVIQPYLSRDASNSSRYGDIDIVVKGVYEGEGQEDTLVKAYRVVEGDLVLIASRTTTSQGKFPLGLQLGGIEPYYFTVDFDGDGTDDTIMFNIEGYFEAIAELGTDIELIWNNSYIEPTIRRLFYTPGSYQTNQDWNLCLYWQVSTDTSSILVTREDDGTNVAITETFSTTDNYCIPSTTLALDSNYMLALTINGKEIARHTWEIETSIWDMNTATTPTTTAQTQVQAFMLTLLILFAGVIVGFIIPGRGLFTICILSIIMAILLPSHFIIVGVLSVIILMVEQIKAWVVH